MNNVSRNAARHVRHGEMKYYNACIRRFTESGTLPESAQKYILAFESALVHGEIRRKHRKKGGYAHN